MDLIFLRKKGNKKIVIDLDVNEIKDIGEILQIKETHKRYNTYFILTSEKFFAYNYKRKELKTLTYHKNDLELFNWPFSSSLFSVEDNISWIKCDEDLKFFDGYGDPIALEGYKTAYYYSYLDGVYISKSDNEDAFSNSKIELFDPITKTGSIFRKKFSCGKKSRERKFFWC